MKPLSALITFFLLLLPIAVTAATPITFEEAKRQSSEEGKPMLLEFFRED